MSRLRLSVFSFLLMVWAVPPARSEPRSASDPASIEPSPVRTSPGTAFTYQGRARSGGVAISGSHNFDVRLFSVPTGGTQIGSTNSFTGVTVTNGLFSLTLDFGSVWDGSARYLGITLDGGVEMSPRTPVNPNPYAMHAADADSATTASDAGTLGGINSSGFLHIDGSNMMTGNLSLGSNQIVSTLPTGTAPFSIASTTVVTNLNADLLDGLDSAAFSLTGHTHAHSSLTGLTIGDDHTQYAFLAGRSGGQSLSGGIAASNSLTLDSTTNATKGNVLINPSGGKVAIATASPGASDTVTVAGTTTNTMSVSNTGGTNAINVSASAAGSTGVLGASSSTSGTGVFGQATNSSNSSSTSIGVRGDNSATNIIANFYGVQGNATGSSTGRGVGGFGGPGTGVYGNATASGTGVLGDVSSSAAVGVLGQNTSSSATNISVGVRATSSGGTGRALYASHTGTGAGFGVYTETSSVTGVALLANAAATTTTAIQTGGNIKITGTSGTTGLTFPDNTTLTSANTGQTSTTVFGTSTLSVTSATTTMTLIPGLTQTVTVPANSVVYIATDGGVQTTGTGTTGFSNIDVSVFIDGAIPANGGYRRITSANTGGVVGPFAYWNASLSTTLTAASHTIDVRARYTSGSTANVSGDNTSVIQGELTVTILKK